MKKVFFIFFTAFFFNLSPSAQTAALKRVVSLEQAVKTPTDGWQKMYVQENDSTLHVYRVKSDGQKAKIQDLGTLSTERGDAWKGPATLVVKPEEKKDEPAPLPAGHILVDGVQYAPYTGSEAPASAPGVAKPGYLFRNGRWYKKV